MKGKLFFIGILTIIFLSSFSDAFAQLNLPRESQRASVLQTIGDTNVSIIYHRPNAKNRKIWGELVPFGKVWRTGANEATLFEVVNDIKINGQLLPKGKYSLHTIPNKDEWTIIFNKTWNQWGSFNYDAKEDVLRVQAKPQTADFQETMLIAFENVRATSADAIIRWENVRVPFTVDVGDVNARTLTEIRKAMSNLKPDDFRSPREAANWILEKKLAANYQEALGWLDAGLKNSETYGLLFSKARLLAEMGKKAEAIAIAERAVQVGKAAAPPANTSDLEKLLAAWKTGQ